MERSNRGRAREENLLWTVTDNNTDNKPITSKGVLKIKKYNCGEVERHKARPCARGFTQMKVVDYTETFAPTTRYGSIRVVLSLAAKYNYEDLQFGIRTALLYEVLEEDICMKIHKREIAGSDKACKLNKSLHGLKRAPRCWNSKFTILLKSLALLSENPIFVFSI